MTWELLTGTKFYGDNADMTAVVDRLLGNKPLASELELAPAVRKSFGNQAYRDSVLAMLGRDPSLRPSMPDLVRTWTNVFQQTSAAPSN